MSDLLPWMAPWSGRILTIGLFLVGLAWMTWSLFIRGRTGGAPRCRRCRYNLTGSTSATCPECGATIGDRTRLAQTRRYWGHAVVALIVAMTLPVYVVQRRVRTFGWDYYLMLDPLYQLSPRVKIEERRVGAYLLRVTRDRKPDQWEKRLDISLDGDVLFSIDDYMFDLRDGLPADITGDGKTDIAVIAYSGGAHCCNHQYVLTSDGGKLRVIKDQETADSMGTFEDLDGDGVHEFIYHDMSFAYWKTSYASSPAPQVIERYDPVKGEYRVAIDLMRTPEPDMAMLRAEAEAMRGDDEMWQGSDPPPAIWGRMLALTYGGHEELASWFFELAWRPGHAEYRTFMAEYEEVLASSVYGGELKAAFARTRQVATVREQDAGR